MSNTPISLIDPSSGNNDNTDVVVESDERPRTRINRMICSANATPPDQKGFQFARDIDFMRQTIKEGKAGLTVAVAGIIRGAGWSGEHAFLQ